MARPDIPQELIDEATGTGSAPTAAPPAPDAAPVSGVMNVDGCKQVKIQSEIYGTSGTLTCSIQIYLYDGAEWSKADAAIDLSETETAAGADARSTHSLDVEGFHGLAAVVSAIAGTGAKASCHVTRVFKQSRIK